jgi:hypothetical protein
MRGVIVTVALVVGLGAVPVGCSASPADQVAESSEPVLVPDEPFAESYGFTLYAGWHDNYELVYNSELGEVEHVRAFQLTPDGIWRSNTFGEGLSDEEVAAVEQARDDAGSGGEACRVALDEPEIQLCVYPVYRFLVRGFPSGDGTTWLVVDYHDNPAAARGQADTTRYNPDSVEARFVTTGFEAVPLDTASDRYLVER